MEWLAYPEDLQVLKNLPPFASIWWKGEEGVSRHSPAAAAVDCDVPFHHTCTLTDYDCLSLIQFTRKECTAQLQQDSLSFCQLESLLPKWGEFTSSLMWTACRSARRRRKLSSRFWQFCCLLCQGKSVWLCNSRTIWPEMSVDVILMQLLFHILGPLKLMPFSAYSLFFFLEALLLFMPAGCFEITCTGKRNIWMIYAFSPGSNDDYRMKERAFCGSEFSVE